MGPPERRASAEDRHPGLPRVGRRLLPGIPQSLPVKHHQWQRDKQEHHLVEWTWKQEKADGRGAAQGLRDPVVPSKNGHALDQSAHSGHVAAAVTRTIASP